MKKAELRKIYKEKRIRLSEEEIHLLDEGIMNQLKAYDWSAIRYLHCYLPITKFKEFNTYPFISWIWKNYPEIKVLISKSDFENGGLNHYAYTPDLQLVVNSWGIPEPASGEQVNAEDIDAVLAPMLVVDEDGNRVGYGKGFYDRFFASCRENVQRLGLSYFPPVAPISDVNPWDVSIERVFTPEKTYVFKG